MRRATVTALLAVLLLAACASEPSEQEQITDALCEVMKENGMATSDRCDDE